MHYALEMGHKQPSWVLDFVGKTFLKEYNRIIDEEEVFITFPKMKKAQSDGLDMLERFTHDIETGKISAKPFAVEKEFKLPFEDEIVIVGKIDRVDVEDDEYIITDYKSGSTEPTQWFLDHDLQFTTYAWACLQLFGKLPKRLVWHHLRNGKLIETTRTMEDIEQLMHLLHSAIVMNNQGIRYRVYHSQVCKWCDYAGPGKECEDKELEKELLQQRQELLNAS